MATQTRDPTSDQTVSGTWSGSAGSRYTLVNDYPDASSTKLTGGTATSVITFGFSAFSIPAGSTSISVQVNYYDGEAASGNNNCGGRIVVGGSTYNATTHNPSGTGGTSRSDNWATNPKSSAAWTVDDVNGVGGNALQQFGINSTDSNPTYWIASIQLQVTYTPPVSGTLAATEAKDAASLRGTVAWRGSMAATEPSDGASASGTVAWLGAMDATEAADTLAFGGEVTDDTITGTLATTDSPDTSALEGEVLVSGGIAPTESADASALGGVVRDALSGWEALDGALITVNNPDTIHRMTTTPWYVSGKYSFREEMYPEGTQVVATSAFSGDDVEVTGNYNVLGSRMIQHPMADVVA